MTTPPVSSASGARLPGWLTEALDVLGARRRLVVATAVGLVLLGAIVALLLPGVLPPRPVVGAAVGIAAALLATALALAMDASDLVVRGTRHVRAAGGTVDVRVSRQADDVGPLLAAVARHASDGQVRVALSAASRKAGVPGVRAAALAEALARTGRKVLLTDLTRGGSPAAGLSDVIAGTRTLPEVVRFEQELYLARLAVGSDPDVAMAGFADWVDALPSDLEVLVVALPPLAERGVVKAASSLDCTLVLVEVDRTERVDLIASLDAVDAAGLTSELVLVDPQRTAAGSATSTATAALPDSGTDQDRDAELEDGAEVATGDDARPEAEPEGAPPVESEPAAPVVVATDVPDVDEDEDDLLAALGVTGDAPGSEAAPEEAVSGPDAGGARSPWESRDGGSERGAGEVAALLGGAGAAAAGRAAFGAPTSVHDDPTGASDQGDDLFGGGDEDPDDATAEISMPWAADEGDDDRLSHIWDEPAADAEPAPPAPDADAPAPDADEPAPDAPTADAPAPDAPAPVDAVAEASAEPEEQVVAAPAPGAPSVAVDESPAAPSPGPPGESPAGTGAGGLDPAALEAARTSAALHQLAQQIWDRDQG